MTIEIGVTRFSAAVFACPTAGAFANRIEASALAAVQAAGAAARGCAV